MLHAKTLRPAIAVQSADASPVLTVELPMNSLQIVSGAVQITKLERVQNPVLWDAYLSHRNLICRKYGKGLGHGSLRVNKRAPGSGAPIERPLWHGTGRGNITPTTCARPQPVGAAATLRRAPVARVSTLHRALLTRGAATRRGARSQATTSSSSQTCCLVRSVHVPAQVILS
jgi:hypothetical protein